MRDDDALFDDASTVPPALDLHAEIAALRGLLRAALAAAHAEGIAEHPPRDPVLAVTRLADAIARAVRVQRLLDADQPDPIQAAMLRELEAMGLGYAEQ